MKKYTYIIVGASAAGIACASKIRDNSPEESIAVITDEKEMPYNRCLLADYIAQTRSQQQVMTKPEEFFQEKRIDLIRSTKITHLDPEKKLLSDNQGNLFEYKKLCLATGRSGFKLKIPGADLHGVFSFYGLHDATSIDAFCTANQPRNALVIGAGFSGIECADALATRGMHVTIIDQEQQPLPRQLHKSVATYMLKLMADKGISFKPSISIASLTKTESGLVANMTNGSSESYDMVIMAVGGRLNTDFAQNANIATAQGGIIVNPEQQTSDPNIYAAGDCAYVYDQVNKTHALSMIWPDAVKQGMIAGSCMSGNHRSYEGAALVTSSQVFGTTFVTAGPVCTPPTGSNITVNTGDNFVHMYLTQDEKLIGFCLIGGLDRIGELRKKLISGDKL